jgi:segregation and condensation protein A
MHNGKGREQNNWIGVAERMSDEENILKMIIEKESWEEVIYQIISLENLNPWDVDLVKLTDRFIEYLNKLEKFDFRVPGKIVFVAALLLRLKADYLSIFEEEETIEDIAKQPQMVDLGIDPSLVKLGLPMRRIPKRQITLEELMGALQKAMQVRVRRDLRKHAWRERIASQIVEEDITKRIERMMGEIESAMKKQHSDQVSFNDLVKKWEREEIISKFIPLLHLEQDKKISTEQIDFFKDIIIKKLEEETQ